MFCLLNNLQLMMMNVVPIGLKYRNEILLHSFFSNNFSQICFVSPYGDSAFLNGVFSETGNTSGFPYTVQEEEK